MTHVHSFDVFDTSLIRKVASPPDVFRLLGGFIKQKANIKDEGNFIEEFLSSRIRAEQQARLKSAETTLDQIWVYLRDMLPQLPISVGFDDELDIERKVLLPNWSVAKQVAQLRSEGARIIFISDTYFSEEFVREQLARHGIADPADRIYVSNAAGVAKWTGDLFKLILAREGLAPGDLHHHGDNFHSDVKVPRRLGIAATLLEDTQLSATERAILSKDAQYRIPASLLAGHMRAFRLSADFRPGSGADELVATFLGPALLVWAAWVLRTAQRDGVRRLYFVSRDAYLLCGVARILAGQFGDIDCRHLRISRQSTLLPCTEEISPSEMPWLRRPSQAIRIADLVKKLSIEWSDVAQYFETLTKGQGESWLLRTDNEWKEFWRILQSPPLADLLWERIRHEKTALLAYLRSEGLCDGVPAGIVDLGWYMDVQSGLRRLLERDEKVAAPNGYYLGVCLGRKAPAEAGKVTALFYEQPTYHQWVASQYEVFRRIDVLDNVIGLAPYGTVSGYEIRGATVEVLGPPESASRAEFVKEIGRAVELFCQSIHGDALWYSDGQTAREIMDVLVRAWCFNPNNEALKALDHVSVTDGMSAIPSQPLLQPWRWLDAVKTLIPGRLREQFNIRTPNPVWPEAAFHRSGLFAQFILRISVVLRLLRGRSDAEFFSVFGRWQK